MPIGYRYNRYLVIFTEESITVCGSDNFLALDTRMHLTIVAKKLSQEGGKIRCEMRSTVLFGFKRKIDRLAGTAKINTSH